MTTLARVPMARRRSRGGAWLYVLTSAIAVVSFGVALLLILRNP